MYIHPISRISQTTIIQIRISVGKKIRFIYKYYLIHLKYSPSLKFSILQSAQFQDSNCIAYNLQKIPDFCLKLFHNLEVEFTLRIQFSVLVARQCVFFSSLIKHGVILLYDQLSKFLNWWPICIINASSFSTVIRFLKIIIFTKC